MRYALPSISEKEWIEMGGSFGSGGYRFDGDAPEEFEDDFAGTDYGAGSRDYDDCQSYDGYDRYADRNGQAGYGDRRGGSRKESYGDGFGEDFQDDFDSYDDGYNGSYDDGMSDDFDDCYGAGASRSNGGYDDGFDDDFDDGYDMDDPRSQDG